MSEDSNSADAPSNSVVGAARLRIDSLLLATKERAVREMAEVAACAVLLGTALDEVYFENVTALDGVEEAIAHIILSAQPRAVDADRELASARTIVEHLRTELEDGVRRATATVRSSWAPALWLCPAERIADLIYDQMVGRGGRGPAPPIPARPRRGVGLGPAACRRLGYVVLSHRGRQGGRAQDTSPAAGRMPAASAEGANVLGAAYDHIERGNELEPELAIAEYQRALAAEPDCVMGHFFLAQAFDDVGNTNAALAEFSRVTKLAPDDPDGHWCLGDALLDIGNVEAAAKEYATALRIAPGDEWLQEQFALLDPEVDGELRDAIRDQLSKTGN